MTSRAGDRPRDEGCHCGGVCSFSLSEPEAGTVGTVLQEPQPELEPSLFYSSIAREQALSTEVGTENPETVEPSHARTVTESHRIVASLEQEKQKISETFTSPESPYP